MFAYRYILTQALLIETLLCKTAIDLWKQDMSITLDPVGDLGKSIDVVKTSILRDSMAIFSPTGQLAYSRNNYQFYYNASKDINNVTLLSSIAQNNNSTGLNTSIVFAQNDTLQIDYRNFSDLRPRNQSALLTDKVLANYSNYSKIADSVFNCFDARFLEDTLVVVCKLFNYKVTGTNNSQLVIYKATGVTPMEASAGLNVSVEESELYNSSNPHFPMITWPKFATAIGKEELYLQVVDDDLTNNSSKIFMFVAGYKDKDVKLSIGKIYFKVDSTDITFNLTTKYCSSFTLSNTITNVGGAVTSRNMIVSFFSLTTNPYEIICYNKDETEFNEDKIRTLFGKTSQTIFQFVCRPVRNDYVTKVAMDKIYTPTKQTEIDIYFRVALINNPAAPEDRHFTVEPVVVKVIIISSSNSVTYLAKTKYDTPKGWYENMKIVVVIPNKLFYVCWLAQTNLLDKNTFDPFRTCGVVDLYTINDLKFDPNDTSTVQNTISLNCRLYGPFGSINFDFDSNGDLVSMLAYKYFVNQIEGNNKVLTLYDLKKLKYSVPVNVQSGTNMTDPSKTRFNITSLDFEEYFPISNPGDIKFDIPVYLNASNSAKIYFMNKQNILLELLSNRLNAPEPKFICDTTGNVYIETCQITPVWRFSVKYTPPASSPTATAVILDNRYLEFDTVSVSTGSSTSMYKVRMGYYDLKYWTNSTTGTSIYEMASMFKISNKEFIGQSLFSYNNFYRAEKDGRGLYVYFKDATNYGVIRFDLILGTLKSGIFSNPVRLFESASKYYIMSYMGSTTDANVKTVINISYADKIIGESSEKDLKANLKEANITLDYGYTIDSIDNLYVEYDAIGKNVMITLIVRSIGKLSFNKLITMGYSLSLASSTKAADTVLIYRKIIDESFVNDVYDKSKCIYKDTVLFVRLISNKRSVIIYNTTKASYYEYIYDKPGTASPILICAKDFTDIYYSDTRDSVLMMMNADKMSYKRIRSILRDQSFDNKFAFSNKVTTQVSSQNQFDIDMKYESKFYLNITLKDSALNANSDNDLNKILGTLSLKITSTNDSKVTLTETLLPILLQKTNRTTLPVYAGNETVDNQKKILFKEGQSETYNIEQTFQFPFDMFNLQIDNPNLYSKIKIKKRIRSIVDFDLMTDYSTTDFKSCTFSEVGASTVKIVDNVMLRVVARDEGFCMELSLIQTSDQKLPFQREKPAILIQANGVISACTLMRDVTISTTEELATRKSGMMPIDYGISCTYSEGDTQYLWLLRVPLANTVLQAFKLSEYLMKIPINIKYTDYQVAQIGAFFHYTLFNARNKTIYFSPKLVSRADGYDVNFIKLTGTAIAYSYYKPLNKLDIKESGFCMDVVTINTATKNASELFSMESYAINQGKFMSNSALKSKYLLREEIDLLSCAYQTGVDLISPNQNCAFLFSPSDNVMFYRTNMTNKDSKDMFVPQFSDFVIKSLKTVYLNREFYYITLSYSPESGMRYLTVMKHANNETIRLIDQQPRTNFSLYDIVIYDSIDLTSTTVDIDYSDLSVFSINQSIFMSVTTQKELKVYTISTLSLEVDKSLSWDELKNSKILIVDHKVAKISDFSLLELFRDKRGLTYMWLIIVGVTVGAALIIIGIYLILKKNNMKLLEEINQKPNYKRDKLDVDKSIELHDDPRNPGDNTLL